MKAALAGRRLLTEKVFLMLKGHLLILTTFFLSCSPADLDGGFWLKELQLESVSPRSWLRGTKVTISGQGFISQPFSHLSAVVQGQAGNSTVSFQIDLLPETEEKAAFFIDDAVLSLLPLDGPPLFGKIVVQRFGERQPSVRSVVHFEAEIVSALTPVVSQITPAVAYPGERIQVLGDNFLMPGEGITFVRLDGQFNQQGHSSAVPKNGIYLPLEVANRNHASFRLTPDLLGIFPGVFEGKITVLNQSEETLLPGNVLGDIQISIGLPYIEELSPLFLRRGQQLHIQGKGFLGLDGDLGTSTFFIFVGTHTQQQQTTVYTDTNPLVLVPDHLLGNHEAIYVLRVQGRAEDDFVTKPGIFEGIVRPQILFGGRTALGRDFPVRLEIGRQIQIVYVRFMPSFDTGLQAFGLEHLSDRIRNRVLEICRHDYDGISIEFRDERPVDFIEYTTAEIMGKDPNNAGLLGLDNSFGKDVGNMRFDELIGGYSALSEEAGYYPYGGVFVESFQAFSPTLAGTAAPMTSPAFDQIFSSFMPALRGRPVQEREFPGSERDSAIMMAANTLGNLIGDTLVHEVGHALGLAAVEGDVHNYGDNPGYIMDAGSYRPFEERAQLFGAHPRVFAPYNRAYLEEILPIH